jgi:hypothetical protein
MEGKLPSLANGRGLEPYTKGGNVLMSGEYRDRYSIRSVLILTVDARGEAVVFLMYSVAMTPDSN